MSTKMIKKRMLPRVQRGFVHNSKLCRILLDKIVTKFNKLNQICYGYSGQNQGRTQK